MARSSRPLLGSRRVVAGYTQEGLAEALGVDRTTVSRWERGEHLPHPWQRPDLARVLGVTLEQLVLLCSCFEHKDGRRDRNIQRVC